MRAEVYGSVVVAARLRRCYRRRRVQARGSQTVGGWCSMPERPVAVRVENLERRVELLEALPGRLSTVELQIVQLRTEMHEQFSAVRRELGIEIQAVREELRAEISAVRTDLRGGIKAEGEAIRTELRAEIREGDEETRRCMCVLHEEVLARIATIHEGRARRRKR